MDVHAASTTVAVVSQAGKPLKDFPVETNGRALVEAIRLIPGHKHVVLEEGTQSAWLYETLTPHVEEVVVAGVTRSRGQKNDSLDAYGLAQKLRTGTLDKRIFKAPQQFTLLRELARTHSMITRDLVRAQARIKSIYRSRAVASPGSSVYGESSREQCKKLLSPAARMSVARLYEQYDFLLALKNQSEKELIAESRKHRITRVLRTAPGLGPIRVARLLPIVVTPHRFRWRACGLNRRSVSTDTLVFASSPARRLWVRASDGGWQWAPVKKTRGLSRQHNHILKDIFKGAANTVIAQPRARCTRSTSG